MNCPVCHIELNDYSISDIELDICTKCEGVWFDKGEFTQIVDGLLSTGAIKDQPLKKALIKKVSFINETQQRTLHCLRCDDQLDIRNFFFDSNVLIDVCSSCHGL